eukprot:10473515-Karenia_brevis.AAC.1
MIRHSPDTLQHSPMWRRLNPILEISKSRMTHDNLNMQLQSLSQSMLVQTRSLNCKKQKNHQHCSLLAVLGTVAARPAGT